MGLTTPHREKEDVKSQNETNVMKRTRMRFAGQVEAMRTLINADILVGEPGEESTWEHRLR